MSIEQPLEKYRNFSMGRRNSFRQFFLFVLCNPSNHFTEKEQFLDTQTTSSALSLKGTVINQTCPNVVHLKWQRQSLSEKKQSMKGKKSQDAKYSLISIMNANGKENLPQINENY